MKLKSSIGRGLRSGSLPVLRELPIEYWPRLAAKLHGIQAPRTIVPNTTITATCGTNIKIIFDLLEQTRNIHGNVAECGVYSGATLIPIALYLKQHGIEKTVFGFDSFQGFDESVNIDIQLGGRHIETKRVGGLGDSSFEGVKQKLERFGLSSSVSLVKGYFCDTLPNYRHIRLSFVHLDCDLYQSYKDALEFLYPCVNPGGIVLLDEYNDSPWPGCNKAVDEFLADKPERLLATEIDNFQKWYFRKQEVAQSPFQPTGLDARNLEAKARAS